MDVSADYDAQDGTLTLASPAYYLLVSATPSELATLSGITGADWEGRRSLAVGTSLGHGVFWCVGEVPDEVQVLVGHDDETWALALTVPLAVVQSLPRLAAEA